MARKTATPVSPEEIEAKALALMKSIRRNEERKPEDRVDHTVTVAHEGGKAVMVCGSAHELEGLFLELVRKRPELRQVMENALTRYGQTNLYKI